MRKLARTIAVASLLAAASVSLSGCAFLDNIFCDLLSLPVCDAGDISDGFGGMGGQSVKTPTSIGEAQEP
jgi:hypothetical protein